MVINILQMIYMGHVLEAPGPYQKALLLWKTPARFYNHRNKKLPSQRATSNATYRNIILYIFKN